MEDHHVDRPGVEVRQRMQLTGTNSSIDLITPIYNIHQAKLDDLYRSRQSGFARRLRGRAGKPAACSRMLFVLQHERRKKRRKNGADIFPYCLAPLNQLLKLCVLRRPGGYGGAAAPDPIPNSAVKRSSANGTSSQDAGE